jgi:hypothetical protein
LKQPRILGKRKGVATLVERLIEFIEIIILEGQLGFKGHLNERWVLCLISG